MYSHWPLLCMKNKKHYDAYIDFAVKYTLTENIPMEGQLMRWNLLVIRQTYPTTFRIVNWIQAITSSLDVNSWARLAQHPTRVWFKVVIIATIIMETLNGQVWVRDFFIFKGRRRRPRVERWILVPAWGDCFLEYKYRMGSSLNEDNYTAFNSIKLSSSAWDLRVWLE